MSKTKPKAARLRASKTGVPAATQWIDPRKAELADQIFERQDTTATQHYRAWLEAQLRKISSTDAEAAAAPDLVNHPPHYMRGGVECIDVVEAMATGWSPQTALRLGQAVQYIFRHAHKGEAVRDLRKAVFWVQREIDALQMQERAS